jgi:NAD(P)-dependent dehydrogenase (short-subunit alcohol dehydrogenase family)
MTRFRIIGNNGFTTEDHPEPEVWAGVVVWLASPAARVITGQVIVCDAGQVLVR